MAVTAGFECLLRLAATAGRTVAAMNQNAKMPETRNAQKKHEPQRHTGTGWQDTWGVHVSPNQAVTTLHPMNRPGKQERGISMHGVLQMGAVICTLHAYHTQAVTPPPPHERAEYIGPCPRMLGVRFTSRRTPSPRHWAPGTVTALPPHEHRNGIPERVGRIHGVSMYPPTRLSLRCTP